MTKYEQMKKDFKKDIEVAVRKAIEDVDQKWVEKLLGERNKGLTSLEAMKNLNKDLKANNVAIDPDEDEFLNKYNQLIIEALRKILVQHGYVDPTIKQV